MRIICEVEDLKFVTPAFVSRNGVIQFNCKETVRTILFKSWEK